MVESQPPCKTAILGSGGKIHLRLLECHRTKIIIVLRPEREKSKIQPKLGWTGASFKGVTALPWEILN